MIIDPSELDTHAVYKLLIGAVLPRPIAWVSTKSHDDILNLAPYSFFNVVSREPPMLGISIGPRTGGESYPKDTLTNICDRQEYVINIVSMPLANAMHESSINYPPEVDEFERAGVTPAQSETIDVPRVKEAKINMECTLDRIIELGSDHLVIGRMQRYHVQDELFHNGRIDTLKLDPLARLAGDYSRIETVFDLPVDDKNFKK